MSKRSEVSNELKGIRLYGLSITTTVAFHLNFAPEEGEVPFSIWIDLKTEDQLRLIKAWLDTDKVKAYETVDNNFVRFYLPDHNLTFLLRF